MGHEPMMPAERARKIREWQDTVFESEMARTEETRVEYLGLTLRIPPQVQPITGMSHLLGTAVTDEVRETDRVLGMGTVSGTSGDADYLYKLIGEAGLDAEKLRIRNLEKDGLKLEVFTLQLTRGAE